MAKAQTYSMEKVLAAREALRQLPVKEKEKSGAEVVDFLKADLRKALKQGHSLKEIQAILADQGVSVSLSRMEAVLGQPGKDSARKKPDYPGAKRLFTTPKGAQSRDENRVSLVEDGKRIAPVSGKAEDTAPSFG
jgi:hypothetical protein